MSNQTQIEAPVVQTPNGFSADILKESLVQDTASPPPPSEPTKTVTYRDLLSNSNFRRLWFSQGITTFGSFFTRVAIPIYVFNLTGSYNLLGFSFFITILPTLLFGLFAGALVDRWDRRRTMINADLLSGLLLCALIGMILIPETAAPVALKLGAIYVIIFLTSTLHQIFTPARIAIFTEVVEENELLTANSLDQSTQTLGEMLSYPIAAYALVTLGPALAFGVDAASFFLSALLIWGVKVRPRAAESSETTSIWRDIKVGINTVNNVPLLRKIVLLSLIVPLLFMLYATLQLPFAVEELGSTAEVGFPALEGAIAIGVTVGMLMLGRWGQHIARWKLLAGGMFGFGFFLFLIGMVPQIGAYLGIAPSAGDSAWTPLLLLAIVFTFLAGMTNSLIFACIRTVQQEASPRGMVGRVASVVSVASGIGFSVGALMTGLGEGRADIVIAILGAILFAIGLFSIWWLRTPQAKQTVPQPVPEQSF